MVKGKNSGKKLDSNAAYQDLFRISNSIGDNPTAEQKKSINSRFKATCEELDKDTFFKVLYNSFEECCNINSKSKLNNAVLFTSMLDVLRDEKQSRKVQSKDIDDLLGKMIRTLEQTENKAGRSMPPEFETEILAAIDKIVPMSEKPKMEELKAKVVKKRRKNEATPPLKGIKKEKEWEIIDIPTNEEMSEQQAQKAPSKTPGVLSKIGRFFTGKGR